MAFDVSNLSEFTMAATDILRSAVLFSDDFSRFEMETGIQHKKYLNYLDANPYVQAGACGLSASGSTELTQKVITVVPWAFRDSWCIDALNQKDLNFGTGTLNGKMVPNLQTALFTDESEKIKQIVDKKLWQGTTSGGDLINGWLYQFKNDSTVLDMATGTTVTVSNINGILTGMTALVPEEVEMMRGQLTIHMSVAFFNLYKQNRINANMYHDNPNTNGGLMTQTLFGWNNVTIVAEPGLTGSKDMVLTWDKNLVIGTDEMTEVSSAKIYYDENTDYLKYKSSFKLGASYKFGGEVVLFQGA